MNEIMRKPKCSRSSPSVIVLESKNGNKGTLHQKSDNDSTTGELAEAIETKCKYSFEQLFREFK